MTWKSMAVLGAAAAIAYPILRRTGALDNIKRKVRKTGNAVSELGNAVAGGAGDVFAEVNRNK